MNKQEIFDTVVEHARKQGCKAIDVKNGCLYRAPDGKKCFVGALFTDDEYDPGMEQETVSSLIVGGFMPKRLLFNEDESLCEDFYEGLQCIHDNREPEIWERELEIFADEWDLVYRGPHAQTS